MRSRKIKIRTRSTKVCIPFRGPLTLSFTILWLSKVKWETLENPSHLELQWMAIKIKATEFELCQLFGPMFCTAHSHTHKDRCTHSSSIELFFPSINTITMCRRNANYGKNKAYLSLSNLNNDTDNTFIVHRHWHIFSPIMFHIAAT